MTRDELADYFKIGLDELHAQVNALDTGPLKNRMTRKADVLHRLLDDIKADAVDDGLIQPFSGGEPK